MKLGELYKFESGIYGYGNLGKGVELSILQNEDIVDLNLLDKLISVITFNDIKPVICFTKLDLLNPVEAENIANLKKYYENYENYNVVALLKSQPTVVDKVVTSGMMGGNMNNYYLNDGTGVIVLQAEGDRYEPITDENWDVIGWDTIAGLNIEVGKKLPVDFMANIDFKVVTDEETWLPTGEVYGAPVMTFVPKATGEVID